MRSILPLLLSLTLIACATPKAQQGPVPSVLDSTARAAADAAINRGTTLFFYDRLAWVASDIYQGELERAQVPPPQSVDWAITRLPDGGHLVSFLLDLEDAGGFVDGEVRFAPGVDPDACIRAADDDRAACEGITIARGVRPPTEHERSWAVARRTMLRDPQLRLCTEAPPNFTVIEDQGETVGYVLSATLERSKLVMSGHTRYRLSADGSEILERQPLFETCMVADREKSTAAVALMLSSNSSDLFNESHVFLMLDQRQPVFVIGRLGHKVLIETDGGRPSWKTLE